jgi:sugar fermentation stimulation protein A
VDGREETVHVKNTGRCKELLVPGAQVYLTRAANPARKTACDLIAVRKGDRLINMDAQAPNQVMWEALAGGLRLPGQPGAWRDLRREVVFGASRFDLWGRVEPDWQAYIEVKGVTLEENDIASFPDAPTVRGARHLRELAAAAALGFAAYAVFVIQMEAAACFTPNDRQDPDFGRALREAVAAGVRVLAYECETAPDSLTLGRPVALRL